MNHAATLRQAKHILTEDRWCQMGFACDDECQRVRVTSGLATRFCAAGAVLFVTDTMEEDADLAAPVLDYLARAASPNDLCEDVDDMIGVIADLNDRCGKKDRAPDLAFKAVHKMYDRAIELAERAA